MKKKTFCRATTGIHLGCFGHFRREDLVCRNHCAVRIRCAIEKDQKIFMEVFEEMEANDEAFLKSH